MPAKKNYEEATKKSVIWSTTLPVSTQMARFINSLILARLLSPEAFGIIGIISVVMYYADVYTDFGFGKALIQRKRIKTIHFQSYFTFNICISLFLFFLITFFSENIAAFFDIPELSDAFDVFAFYLLITAFITPIKIKLARDIQYKTIAIIDAIRCAIQIPTSLTLALNGYGFWSIVYAMLAGQIFALVIFAIVNKGIIIPTYKIGFLKTLFAFSKWDFVGGQANLISENIDKLFLAKALGAGAVGLYDRAYGIAVMPYSNLSNTLSMVFFANFSRNQNSKEQLAYYFNKFVSVKSFLMIPMLFGLIAVADLFVLTLLGEKWIEMITALKIISVAFLVGSLANSFNAINSATGHVATQTKAILICAISLIISLYFFTPYGIDAVALCIVGYHCLRLLLSCMVTIQKVNISLAEALISILPFLFCGFAMVGSVTFFQTLNIFASNWQNLLFVCVSGALVYAFLILLIPFKSTMFIRKKSKRLMRTGLSKIGLT